jgi:hypothetical protein
MSSEKVVKSSLGPITRLFAESSGNESGALLAQSVSKASTLGLSSTIQALGIPCPYELVDIVFSSL